MSADPAAPSSRPDQGPGEASGEASEEQRASELRAAYEAELSRITSTEMIMQAAVSLLNVGAVRLRPSGGPGEPARGERDLEQVRDAIDGVRALLEILERRVPNEMRALRDALSQLQLAYAREARSGAPTGQGGGGKGGGTEADKQPAGSPGEQAERQPSEERTAPEGLGQPRTPGPAESSGRLWVPGR